MHYFNYVYSHIYLLIIRFLLCVLFYIYSGENKYLIHYRFRRFVHLQRM